MSCNKTSRRGGYSVHCENSGCADKTFCSERCHGTRTGEHVVDYVAPAEAPSEERVPDSEQADNDASDSNFQPDWESGDDGDNGANAQQKFMDEEYSRVLLFNREVLVELFEGVPAAKLLLKQIRSRGSFYVNDLEPELYGNVLLEVENLLGSSARKNDLFILPGFCLFVISLFSPCSLACVRVGLAIVVVCRHFHVFLHA